ncbi:MAG TPA: hypothetical protein VF857_08935, partial [Spirochaetota bacterium]
MIPLYHYRHEQSDLPGKTYESYSIWSLLFHYYSSDHGTGVDYRTFWAPIIPLMYYHNESGHTHTNIALLIDYANDEREK